MEPDPGKALRSTFGENAHSENVVYDDDGLVLRPEGRQGKDWNLRNQMLLGDEDNVFLTLRVSVSDTFLLNTH